MARVVIADDEEFVRYFLKTTLQTYFFEVVAEVEKGDKLLDVLMEKQPDILLLDINMPNMTGVEFLEKHVSKFPFTCIIILTATPFADLVSQNSLSGVNCFLGKDTPVEEMIAKITETWENFKREQW